MARSKDEIRQDLADELNRDDDEPVSRVTRFAPPAQQAVDIEAIVRAAVQASLAAQQQAGGGMMDVAKAITEGMAQVRQPKPENQFDPGISERNPFGERDHPLPSLKCEMFYGIIQDKDGHPVSPFEELQPHELTLWETLALNCLEPVEKVVRRLDQAPMRVKVVAKYHDTTGALMRLTIGFPAAVIGKGSFQNRNMVPDITALVYQLSGHDLRRDTLPYPDKQDDLLWLMTEHRAKRYVSKRELVSA